jgi:hypothetical protein
VLGADWGTLAELVGASRADDAPALAVDYVLCVGEPEDHKLHDTGDFGAFPPFVVGYEKVQFRSVLPASMVDLHRPQAADELLATSTYNNIVAGFAYGFAHIARSQAALEQALVTDVVHTLAAAHPTGPIRLAVVAERGSPDARALPAP